MRLSHSQIDRYTQHIIMEEIGKTGQKTLLDSKVLIVGVGGLGSPAAYYLTACGIGNIGLIDSDNVSLSNLQRQILYCSGDIHKKKVFSAQLKLSKLNSDVTIDCYHQRLSNDNAHEYISKYDFILDCTDNFESKYLIAEKCKFYNKPYSHGAILKFAGQTLTVIPGKTACYRCVFPDMPEQQTARNCSKAGVMGVVPGIIGTIQATEAIKYFLKLGNLLTDQLLTYDALNMEFRKVPVSKQRDCFLCN